jgi:cytochrome b6-f complex iron-sulfur subunit
MIMRGLTRYVEDLLRSRRPHRFRASGEDASLARAAVTLRAARPGSGAPAEEFVTALHKKLAAELDPPTARRAVGARRAFLRAATVAAGAAVAGAGLDHALTAHTTAPPGAGSLTPDHGTWRTVTASADLPDGAVLPFTAGAVTGFVERAGGRLRAVSGVCTHQGCRLALAAHPARLVCPCHGAAFALDGAVLTHRLPITLAALPRLAVREAGGAVQVYAPAAGQTSLPASQTALSAGAGHCDRS